MFSVTEAEATAIRDAFHQRGELSAVIELRRLFPGITDNRQARECVRMIAGWRLSTTLSIQKQSQWLRGAQLVGTTAILSDGDAVLRGV